MMKLETPADCCSFVSQWDRASKADYDAWEELGNPGWNWDSMIKYMQRAENVTDDTDVYGSEGIAQGGPIDAGTVELPIFVNQHTNKFK